MAKTTIPINDRFEIRAGSYDWVLVEHVPKNKEHHLAKKDGSDTREYHRFYPSVEVCCKKVVEETGKEGAESAQEIIDTWQKTVDQIKGAMK